MSGSAAEQVQEPRHRGFAVEQRLVHVDVEDVGAAFDLLRGPPRPPPRTARPRISRANFREPVTLVRSPIMMKLLSGRIVSGSRPLQPRAAARPAAAARGGLLATASAIARMCAGVVPQQPPTMFSQPLAANSPSMRAIMLGRLVVAAEVVGQAGVGIAAHVDRREPRQLLDVGPHHAPAPARS